jgi:hypothetical protein
MKQSFIYKIEVNYINNLVGIKQSLPVVSYFSNLKIALESILSILALRGWDDHKINYTAAYRSIKDRGKYVSEFSLKNVKIFRLEVSKVIMNPALSDLGVDQKPHMEA